MKRKMSSESSNCLLFLVVSFLMLFCSVAGTAQNNSVVNLADTAWDTNKNPIRKFNASDNSDTEIIYFLVFYNQGKVKAIVITDKSAGAIEKYEDEYVTNNNGTTEFKQVRKLSRTLPSFNEQSWEGTYRIKGEIVYLDFPSFTIKAIVTATSIDGVLNHKDTNKDEPTLFTKTARPNNSSSDANSSSNAGDKRQLAEKLSAQAMTLAGQANDLISKRKFREAIDIFNQIIAIKLDTKQYVIDAYIKRGIIKLELKEYKGSIEDLSSAIEISTHLKQAAIKSYSEAVAKAKSSSGNSIIKDTLLAAYIGKMKPEERAAMDALTMGYQFRAMAKSELGDKAGACEDYRLLCTSGFGDTCTLPNEFCN